MIVWLMYGNYLILPACSAATKFSIENCNGFSIW